mmetsp:Transcript_33940/g.51310  ORF Transcript_33940/g.51310 Transcript_33940/m.51310 type:complete len:84 (+) Transcript_33940:119-370(+)
MTRQVAAKKGDITTCEDLKSRRRNAKRKTAWGDGPLATKVATPPSTPDSTSCASTLLWGIHIDEKKMLQAAAPTMCNAHAGNK